MTAMETNPVIKIQIKKKRLDQTIGTKKTALGLEKAVLEEMLCECWTLNCIAGFKDTILVITYGCGII